MKIAVDTGGTFTDFFWKEERYVRFFKVPSTPQNPALAILEGLKDFIPNTLIHGTTVGTNAFLERKGGEFLLLTTSGFEDVIFIGRQARPKLYDLFVEKPPHFLKEENVIGVRERIDAKGRPIFPLTEEEIKRVSQEVFKRGIKNLAISFLHSYLNPLHEELLKRAFKERGEFEISLSSEILPEFREYERTSTTAINAYLKPVIKGYLETLKSQLKETEIFIQQSNGGFITLDEAKSFPVHTLLSGPAGGAYGGLLFGRLYHFEKIITFDMGGTSTDVCLINGELPFTREYLIDGFPVSIPLIDIHTVGAGGGSIAYVDAGGMLKVGPESASADPGPACYGKSLIPTVTDANLLLGRLLPERFYGGKMLLDKERALRAIAGLAEKIGLSPLETALGIIKIANIHMARAIAKVSVERGFDPREFTLLSFGGAGGLHACALARELGIPRILVPKFSSTFSAFGLFFANYLKDFSQTLFLRLDEEEAIKEALQKLKERVRTYLLERKKEPEAYEYEYFADIRYLGQGYEISVPFKEVGKTLKRAFEEAHERLYGFLLKDHSLELVTIRIRVVKKNPLEEFYLEEESKAFFHYEMDVYTEKGFERTKVISWEGLKEGELILGPALIVEDFTTFYLEKGFCAKVLSNKTLLVERV